MCGAGLFYRCAWRPDVFFRVRPHQRRENLPRMHGRSDCDLPSSVSAICVSPTMNSSSWRAALKPCPTSFKKRAKCILPNAADSSCEALWDVLTAANRCVCHLENKLLDHNVRPQILRVAVDLVEDIIHAKLTEAHLSNHSLWPAASSAAWLILFSSDANLLRGLPNRCDRRS